MSELLDVDVDRLDELCRRYGIARLEVFGSVARGEPDDGSDIDLLYELAPKARLGWEITDLEDELADLFGRPVDLVSRRALHKMLRRTVLDEAQLLLRGRQFPFMRQGIPDTPTTAQSSVP